MKKRIFTSKVVMCVLLLLSCTSCFSGRQITYQFEKNYNSTGKLREVIYIHTGNFSNKLKANYYKKLLQAKTTYPVKMIYKRNVYEIRIGPVNSLSEVKRVVRNIQSPAERAVVKAIPVSKRKHLFTPNNYTRQTEYTRHTQYARQTHRQTQMSQTQYIRQTEMSQTQIHHADLGAFADLKKPYCCNDPFLHSWFLSIGGGEQYPQFPSHMTVNNGSTFSAPYDEDIYSFKKHNQPVFALSVGHRWERDDQAFTAYSIGLLYQYFFTNNAGGTITQYSIPAFNNYHYHWSISSNLLLARAKVNILRYGKVSPYFSGGVGCAFNRSGSFSETALPGVTPRESPGFSSKTYSQFAYNVGIGIDMQFTKQFIFSVGYEYLNLGKVMSGDGTTTWSDRSLNLSNYWTNEVLFSVSYLIGK